MERRRPFVIFQLEKDRPLVGCLVQHGADFFAEAPGYADSRIAAEFPRAKLFTGQLRLIAEEEAGRRAFYIHTGPALPAPKA